MFCETIALMLRADPNLSCIGGLGQLNQPTGESASGCVGPDYRFLFCVPELLIEPVLAPGVRNRHRTPNSAQNSLLPGDQPGAITPGSLAGVHLTPPTPPGLAAPKAGGGSPEPF